MAKKPQRLLLTTILLTVLLILSACTTLTSNAKALQDATNSTTSMQILPSANATSVTPISPPSVGGSTKIISSNIATTEIPVLPSANVTTTAPFLSPNFIIAANGTIVIDNNSPLTSNSWWLIDYWTNSKGNERPNYMDGTFTAVPNTFNNIPSGGEVMYEPLNVAYGDQSNYIWYQFSVDFPCNGETPSFELCYEASWIPGPYYIEPPVNILGGYIIGDTYDVGFSTSGTNIVTFTITNTNTQNSWSFNSFDYTPPSLNLVYLTSGAYSPASAIEGNFPSSTLNPSNTLTNVPYFQTYIGYPVKTFWVEYDNSPPQGGLATEVWTNGTANYLGWNMLSQTSFSVSSITSYGIYGAGGLSNPTNLVGTQDGNYAVIYGGNVGDGGYIVGQMSGVAGGNIYIYGYSSSGYYSNLYVYVSMDDQNWVQIGSYITISSSTPSWISVGSCTADFEYIAVAGYDTYDSVNLHLDAVKVASSSDPLVPLTVNAYDAYGGQQVYPNVYVDGNWVGTAPVTVEVSSPDYHSITVDDPTWDPVLGMYVNFQYMCDNNGQYGNGQSIYISSDDTITAYYSPDSTVSLTVNAYDAYGGQQVYPNVYVDGNYVGTAPVTIQVTEGYHTITVDDQTYDPMINTWVNFEYFVDNNGYYYGNGQSILITSSINTLNAWYN